MAVAKRTGDLVSKNLTVGGENVESLRLHIVHELFHQKKCCPPFVIYELTARNQASGPFLCP